MELNWQKPEETPVVMEGSETQFWIAVEITKPNKSHEVITFLAQYQNRPYKDGDDDLVNTDGEYVDSVGWVTCQSHCEFDNYYELIAFSDNYKLLGWAKYIAPKFTPIGK